MMADEMPVISERIEAEEAALMSLHAFAATHPSSYHAFHPSSDHAFHPAATASIHPRIVHPSSYPATTPSTPPATTPSCYQPLSSDHPFFSIHPAILLQVS